MRKIKIWTHNDLDGISCAILAYLTFGRENVDVEYCSYKDVDEKVEAFWKQIGDSKYDQVYIIDIPTADDNTFIQINYQGDCARVYADGKLVEDNFWNGKPMLVRTSELEGKRVELKILPLRKDAPI